MTRTPDSQAGLTLVELMVSAALVGLACTFTFSIFASSSMTFRGQSHVAEATQALTAASELIERDLRMTGYSLLDVTVPGDMRLSGAWPGGARVVTTPAGHKYSFLNPLAIVNDSDGPDQIRIAYADPTCELQMTSRFPTDIAQIGTTSSFTTTDRACLTSAPELLVFWRPVDPTTRRGVGCVSRVISTGSAGNFTVSATGTNDALSGRSVAWSQCAQVPGPTNEASPLMHTSPAPMANRLVMRAYRIKDSDARGVLQISMTGGLLNDWQDVGFGFIDLQVAVRVWEPADTLDEDGDGDPTLDWYSGENMESPNLYAYSEATGVTRTVREIRFTLVTKSTQESGAVVATSTPDLSDASEPDNNPVGDHGAVDITKVTDKSSPLYGEYVIRTSTVRVDLRNHGIGK